MMGLNDDMSRWSLGRAFSVSANRMGTLWDTFQIAYMVQKNAHMAHVLVRMFVVYLKGYFHTCMFKKVIHTYISIYIYTC